MLKKRVLCLIAAFLLLSSVPAFAATAGSADDPLVSLSYAKTWSQTVLNSATPSISSTLNCFYETAVKNLPAALKEGVGASLCTLSEGGTVKLSVGSSIVMISGSASLKIDSGAVVNVSTGSTASNGSMTQYNRYIACENSAVTVNVSSLSVFLIDGIFTTTGAASFTDVKASDWFFADVYAAVGMGLINGMTETTYEPGGTLTNAQAVKLAACMHQLYNDGAVTLQNGDPWYRSFADYALKNGIISEDFANYDANITRERFVDVFYNALPLSEYAAINAIADGSIPDVPMESAYTAKIYTFYRAGILTGYTNTPGKAENAFGPADTILRSEVATIMVRMFNADVRKALTLG